MLLFHDRRSILRILRNARSRVVVSVLSTTGLNPVRWRPGLPSQLYHELMRRALQTVLFAHHRFRVYGGMYPSPLAVRSLESSYLTLCYPILPFTYFILYDLNFS